MSKKSYVLAIALLLAVLALAACGGSGASSGSGDTAATTEAGEAANAPASDAAVTSEAQGEAANAGSDTSGAGDTSGANATGEASSATDVGSGSDGAPGSGGSDAASGATSPESDTGAPAAGDDTGNAASGTGGTTDASGNTTDSSGGSGGEGGTGDAGGAATGTGDNNAQVATPAAAYTAVSDAECTEVQGQLSQALGVEVNRATGVASFSDLNGSTGESCQLTITGTGANFASVPETATQIRQVLSDNGWTVDEQYAADSPTATIGGLRRDNQLAAYNVEWSPASGVTCPADQPISACAETLKPEQMNYNITIDLAQQ